MTVYDADPLHTVAQFEAAGGHPPPPGGPGGAKTGQTTNLPTIERIAAQTGLFVEVGAASAAWTPSAGTWRPGPAG